MCNLHSVCRQMHSKVTRVS